MPPAVLFCEGDDRSPDAPVLRAILHGLPVDVRPVGSRGIFRQMLLDHPDARALRDGDFPDDPAAWRPDPAAAPWPGESDWQGWSAGRSAGWRWRRKEIENYLLDPEVLGWVMGWSARQQQDYTAVLTDAMHACAERTAARMAILKLLPKFERPVVKPFDPALSGDALLAELRQRHRRARSPTARTEEEIVQRFLSLRPLCLPGGPCWHPWIIAGKDLAGAFARLPGIRGRFPELLDIHLLSDRVGTFLGAAARDGARVWGWVEEWRAVRGEVEGWIRDP